MTMNQLFTRTEPILPRRGVHLDLKGLPPTFDRLLSLLTVFEAARYNVVLVEWEDAFPWTVDGRFRSPTAYTPEQVTRFCSAAAERGIELIPLVQCLGHMETPLSVDGYEHLRELPDHENCLNPLADGARALIQGMVDDVLGLMPDVQHFHLGGDEAWSFGSHPDTAAYIRQHGKGALYMHHVEPLLDHLGGRDIRPILWHDMMNDWDSPALTALAKKCDLMPWGYQGHPDTTGSHFKTEYIQRFHEHGFQLWAGTAYKGAEGYDSDVPDLALHTTNALAWAEVSQRFGFKGAIATAWSRYAVDTVQCNPIDAALDSMLNVAVILHDGQQAPGGVDACVEALAAIGERDGFLACRDSMQELARLRWRGWDHVKQARQVMVLGTIEKRRTSARNLNLGMKALVHLETVVGKLETLQDTVYQAFDGLVERVWMEEYLATRVEPLRVELAQIQAMRG